MMNPLYSCHCLTFHGLSATTQNGKWENDEQIDKKEDYLLLISLAAVLYVSCSDRNSPVVVSQDTQDNCLMKKQEAAFLTSS